MAKLEEGEAAIHPRLRELVIEFERTIISRHCFCEPTASGKGQSAVQVGPGELRNQDCAGTKVGCGIGVSPLITVANSKCKPGPELPSG